MTSLTPPDEPITAEGDSFTCPMHPEVTSDHPGRCPKCGMFLQPDGQPPAPAAHQHTHPGQTAAHQEHGGQSAPPPQADTGPRDGEWTCPMHPEIRQDGPGWSVPGFVETGLGCDFCKCSVAVVVLAGREVPQA